MKLGKDKFGREHSKFDSKVRVPSKRRGIEKMKYNKDDKGLGSEVLTHQGNFESKEG